MIGNYLSRMPRASAINFGSGISPQQWMSPQSYQDAVGAGTIDNPVLANRLQQLRAASQPQPGPNPDATAISFGQIDNSRWQQPMSDASNSVGYDEYMSKYHPMTRQQQSMPATPAVSNDQIKAALDFYKIPYEPPSPPQSIQSNSFVPPQVINWATAVPQGMPTRGVDNPAARQRQDNVLASGNETGVEMVPGRAVGLNQSQNVDPGTIVRDYSIAPPQASPEVQGFAVPSFKYGPKGNLIKTETGETVDYAPSSERTFGGFGFMGGGMSDGDVGGFGGDGGYI